MHLTGVIDCLILLDRIKTFSPRVKKAFTIPEKKLLSILLLICLFVDFFPIFQYSAYGFDWKYYSSDGKVNTYTVYFLAASAIASSKIGLIIEIIVFVIRDGFTLAFQITLNLICFIQVKRQVDKKNSMMSTSAPSSINSNDRKNKRQRQYETNMSLMVILLCLISTLVRITTLTCAIYWLLAYDLIGAVLGVSADTIIVINSTLPFFIFLRFNRKFRANFSRLLFQKDMKSSLAVTSSNHLE